MNDLTGHRHAAREAATLLPTGSTARVLEPSPPAVLEGSFFADDPTSLNGADPASTVRPFSTVEPNWSQIDGVDPVFARARWLGPWPRLEAVPHNYAVAREDFHRLGYSVIAAARHDANGKFGLRFTAGGFGTPFFGNDRQVRMVGNILVDQHGEGARAVTPSSLRHAGEFIGVEPNTVAAEGDSPALGDLDRPLELDAATGALLGDWFGFATSVLEELRALSSPGDEPGRIQLWPGHFDPAVELGNEDAGKRATFGASPGDGSSPTPYLYVGPWAGVSDDEYWNASSFPGAVLGYDALLGADDQRATAIDFYRRAIGLLATAS